MHKSSSTSHHSVSKPSHVGHVGSASRHQAPGGLETLVGISSLTVIQEIEPLEVFLGWETNNRYSVYNNHGHRIYYCGEDTSGFSRMFLGKNRDFTVRVFHANGREAMIFRRAWNAKIAVLGGEYAGNDVTVWSVPGELYGRFIQNDDCEPNFNVFTPSGHKIMELHGPVCADIGCGDVQFTVIKENVEVVGTIMREFTGKQFFSDADNFGMQFPGNLDVRVKATLLAAPITIVNSLTTPVQASIS